MALDLQAACGMVVRPDIRPQTIKIQCGIHTGPVVAGNFLKENGKLMELFILKHICFCTIFPFLECYENSYNNVL